MTAPAIPTLRSPPLVGSLFEFRKRRLALQLRVVRECGDIGRVRIVHRSAVVVSSPEYARRVLVEEAGAFKKSIGLDRFARPLLGNGLLTSENELHRRQRKLISPGLQPRRIAGYVDDMTRATETAQQGWREGDVVDVHAEMTRLTLGIAAKTMFSSDAAHHAAAVGEAVHLGSRYVLEEVSRPVNIPLSWPTPRNSRLRRALRQLDDIVYGMIRERRESGRDIGDILSMLLLAQDEDDGSTMTDRQVRDEVMTLFLAGHETTANALSWSLYLLGRHPEAYARLRAEADAALGGRTPRIEDLPRLPFAVQVFKEAIRLYPPAYVVGRESHRPFRIGPHELPAGTTVLVNIYGMHRRADLFPEPDRFFPDRFAPEAEKALPRAAYLPFGDGPRICIGNHFAMLEGHVVLATLAQRVELELLPGPEVAPEPMITLRPRDAIRMRVRRR